MGKDDFVEKIIYKFSSPLVMYILASGTWTATRLSQDEVFLSALRACMQACLQEH